MHYLFCSKSFILPWNFVFLQKELTLSLGVNYVFLRWRQVKVQKVRSWGWFTMFNPISKSLRKCLIQNDFANITVKCRICNNEEKCLLCCFDSGLILTYSVLLTITFKSFRIFMIYKICLGELRVWLVFLCSALFFGHWMHIRIYLIIIPVWNGSRYNNTRCACIVEKFNVMSMSL